MMKNKYHIDSYVDSDNDVIIEFENNYGIFIARYYVKSSRLDIFQMNSVEKINIIEIKEMLISDGYSIDEFCII